jgi:hypothetical protein
MTPEELVNEISANAKARRLVKKAVREERERCAKIAEQTIGDCGTPNDCLVCGTRRDIAATIRSADTE